MWAVSINHTTAPVQVRGRFAVPTEKLAAALQSLRETVPHPEVALLSTCNRTEVYCAGSQHGIEPVYEWLAATAGASVRHLRSCSFALRDRMVARHAFRVASGLESMVLGEPQILGQLKVAVGVAEQAGSLGATLNQLFQRSFAVAKDVRSSTALGEHSISMAAAAVRIAGGLFEDLHDTRVLFVGAGEMIDLVATHFAARQPESMTVANRTPARAEALAAKIGGDSMPLGDLGSRLHQFDAVVCCTGSQVPVVGLGAIRRAMKARRQCPMLFIDLAVPNDVEPDAKGEPDVYLYTVDDLCRIVEAGRAGRHAAVAQAEAIVESGVREFTRWLRQRDSVPLIQRLNAQAEAWRLQEFEKAKRLVRKSGPDVALDYLSRRLVGKLLHGARHDLRMADGDAHEHASAAVQRLFLRDAPRRAPNR
jgi:glutamyl-tRNA reductase